MKQSNGAFSSLYFIAWLTAVIMFNGIPGAEATPILDGQITAEGYIHLTESLYAQPVSGGLPGSSDLIGETAAQHRWDDQANGGAGADVNLGSPRADVQNLFAAYDTTYLYIAVEGPTVPFQDWDPFGEQGDLYIAMDTRGGAADAQNDSLNADSGHHSFRGTEPQAVDFLGWQPTFFLGVDWVQNNGFTAGQGYANLEQAGTHNVAAGEGHFANNGGFEWAAGIDGQNRGVYEFQILWTDLGFQAGGPAPGTPLRLAMYTTAEFEFYDTYDSGPGVGQPGSFEEIGDCPNDPDSGVFDDVTGTLGASDGLGDGGADDGSINGSFPGSNYVNPAGSNYGGTPGHADGIDTIQEYVSISITPIPEPATSGLVLAGLLLTLARTPGRKRLD